MRFVTAFLLGTMFLAAACGGNDAAAPTNPAPEIPTVAPAIDTPAPAATEVTSTEITGTTAMTDDMAITATTDLTAAMNMTDNMAMTATATMTSSTEVTETLGITPSEQLTATGEAGLLGVATLQNINGELVGNAVFTQNNEEVTIQVTVEGFTAAGAGEHGIHIHTTGACTPDFAAAGSHFNPTAAQHGMDNPNGPHAGDLPNIEIDADGNGSYEATTTLVTLTAGDNALFDSDGSALVIHANPDDMVTDPSGDSGDRIACGVIEQQQ